MVDLSKLSYFSGVNYLKREQSLEGSALVTLSAPGGEVLYTVTHDLGYIPFVYVGADVDNDGIIWSNSKVHTFSESASEFSAGAGFISTVEISHWVTTSNLTICLTNNTFSQSGQRRIYWVIYLDYEDR